MLNVLRPPARQAEFLWFPPQFCPSPVAIHRWASFCSKTKRRSLGTHATTAALIVVKDNAKRARIVHENVRCCANVDRIARMESQKKQNH